MLDETYILGKKSFEKGILSMNEQVGISEINPSNQINPPKPDGYENLTKGKSITRKIGGTTYTATAYYPESGEGLLDKLWRLMENDTD